MKKILSFILIFVCLFACFSLSACNKNENTYSSWNIEEKHNPEGEALQYYAVFRISAPTNGVKNMSDFWLNLAEVGEGVTIELSFSNSSSILSYAEHSTLITSKDLQKKEGWVCLIGESTSINYSYFEIAVSKGVLLNEVVLISTENKKLSLELVKSGIRPEKGSSSKKEWTKDDITTQLENGEITTSALNLIDEQDKFIIE